MNKKANTLTFTIPKQDERTELYRHYDVDGNLLYVGVSADALDRYSGHKAKKSEWIHLVSRIEITHYNTRSDALKAEKSAIVNERPPYNKAHHHDYRRPNTDHKPNLKLEGWRKVNVWLDAASVEAAQKLGNGNVSEGIRRALSAAAQDGGQ